MAGLKCRMHVRLKNDNVGLRDWGLRNWGLRDWGLRGIGD
jgi:hypothetical protein